ncbi:MAG: helix-turn-helix domain-containing protein [Oscillospiraceae bacterium]|nr:helix-turn-helix domain-containing protein [Oscillospiraceae bacterium]
MHNIEFYEQRRIQVGKRISETREALKLTQDELANKLNRNRTTVSFWESGKRLPPLADTLLMCVLFECELGYLLCDYPCKTKEKTDIQEATGLSEAAIVSLQSLANSDDSLVQLANNAALSFTSELLCCKDFRRLINAFGEARRCKRELATASKFDLEDVEYQRLIPTKWQLEREHSVAVEINGVTSLVVDEEKIEADMRMLARQNAAKKLKSLTEAHTIARFAIAEVISRITDELEDDNHAKA